MDSVTVLMSTYNGEKFISEQLDSIFSQEDVKVRLIVRDDCSTDNTLDILKNYQKEHLDMIIIRGEENLRPCKSFLYLIRTYYDDEYFALCDQDDIWDKNKLIIAINTIKKSNSNNIPILYYSNLRIVNEKNIFERNSHHLPHCSKNKFACLIEHLATGCTIVYNRKMAEIAHEKQPLDFSMHDSWLYQVASFFGNTIYDFVPHINYRQHASNQVGTYGRRIDKKKARQLFRMVFDSNYQQTYKNTMIFYEQFGGNMDEEEKKEVLKMLCYKANIISRVKLLVDKRIKSENWYRNFVFKIKVILGTL